jgi:hypothetical protein
MDAKHIIEVIDKAVAEMKAGLYSRRDFIRRDRRIRQAWYLKPRRLG